MFEWGDDVNDQEVTTPKTKNTSVDFYQSTSIYAIPSRESLKEMRQSAVKRSIKNSLRESPLFGFKYTTSTPVEFTFDEDDTNTLTREGGVEEEKEDWDESKKKNGLHHRFDIQMSSENEKSNSIKRSASVSTASTYESSSVNSMTRIPSEGLSELRAQ
jgi:hypothetical protein